MGFAVTALLALCQGSHAELRQVKLLLTVEARHAERDLPLAVVECANLGHGMVRSWFIRPGMNPEQVVSVMGRKWTDVGGPMRRTTAYYADAMVSIDFKVEFTEADQPKWTVTEVRWWGIPNTP